MENKQDTQNNGGGKKEEPLKIVLLKALGFGILFAVGVMFCWVLITQSLAAKLGIIAAIAVAIAILIKWRGWPIVQVPDNHAILWGIFGSWNKKPIINSKVYKVLDNGDIVPKDEPDELLLPDWLPKSIAHKLQKLIGGWRLVPYWPVGQLMRRRIKSINGAPAKEGQRTKIKTPYWFISLQTFPQKIKINDAELAYSPDSKIDSEESGQVAVLFARDVAAQAALRVYNLYTYLIAGIEGVANARSYCLELLIRAGKDTIKLLNETEVETKELVQTLWAADVLEQPPDWDRIFKKFAGVNKETQGKIKKLKEDLDYHRTADDIHNMIGLAVVSLAISEIEPPKDEQEAMKKARDQMRDAVIAKRVARAYGESKKERTKAEVEALEMKMKIVGPVASKEVVLGEAILNQTAMNPGNPPTIIIASGAGNPPIAISPDFQSTEKHRVGEKSRGNRKTQKETNKEDKEDELREEINQMQEEIEDLQEGKE